MFPLNYTAVCLQQIVFHTQPYPLQYTILISEMLFKFRLECLIICLSGGRALSYKGLDPHARRFDLAWRMHL